MTNDFDPSKSSVEPPSLTALLAELAPYEDSISEVLSPEVVEKLHETCAPFYTRFGRSITFIHVRDELEDLVNACSEYDGTGGGADWVTRAYFDLFDFLQAYVDGASEDATVLDRNRALYNELFLVNDGFVDIGEDMFFNTDNGEHDSLPTFTPIEKTVRESQAKATEAYAHQQQVGSAAPQVQPVPKSRIQLIKAILDYLVERYYLVQIYSGAYFLQDKKHGYLVPINSDTLALSMKAYTMGHFSLELTDGIIKSALDIFCGQNHSQSGLISRIECGRVYRSDDNRLFYYSSKDLLTELLYVPLQQQTIPQNPAYAVPLLINHSAGPYPYPLNPTPHPRVLENLFKGYSINESEYLVLITWMVSTLVLDHNAFLLELIDDDDGRRHNVQRNLKDLIDCCSESFIAEMPSTRKQFNELALDHYVLNFSPVSSLNPSMQKNLLDILNGYPIDVGVKPKRHSYSVFARRPVILSADESVVTYMPLQQRTVTLHLSRAVGGTSHEMCVSLDHYHNAWLQLVGYVNHHMKRFFFEHRSRPITPMTVFRELGVWVCHCLQQDESLFLNQLTYQETTRQELSLPESPVAQALIAYLDQNRLSEESMSAKAWLNALGAFKPANIHSTNWPTSPRALGAAFKQAKPVLAAAGIECFGEKRGSFRVWTVQRQYEVTDDADEQPET